MKMNARDYACQLCYAEGPDKRNLYVECFYDLKEAVEEFDCQAGGIYHLRFCKQCRSELLGVLRSWAEVCRTRREVEKDSDGFIDSDPEKNIPVRIDGAITMMSQSEYKTWLERQ